MGVSIGEFVSSLHRIVPAWQAADWDVSGLQLGDPTAEAEVVGVCHEVTDLVVDRALEARVDAMVTYHPLLFRPTTKLVAGRSPAGRAFRLVSGGVALAVAHTSFDVMPGGTSDALAAAVGLQTTDRFGPVDGAGQVKVVTFVPSEHVESVASAMTVAGGGQIGNYAGCSFRTEGIGAFEAGSDARPVTGVAGVDNREPEIRIEMIAPATRRDAVSAAIAAAHPYEEPAFDVYPVHSNLGFIGRVGRLDKPTSLAELSASLTDSLGAAGARISGDPAMPISTVAVVPGSGSSFTSAARAAGAEVLVTGDVGHHTVVQALDMGLAILDLGHTTSERPGMASLLEMVSRTATATGLIVHDFTGIDPTPWG